MQIAARLWSTALPFALVLGLVLSSAASLAQTPQPPQAAQPIGEVEQLRGAGFAQNSGQLPRLLGRGLALNEGDRLTTADNALAIIKLKDGTKMTLRPNTELVLSQYNYTENGSSNAMVFQLLRGGLRALTGLINKTSPNAARIQTNTATIGIRGTDFDARICQGNECGLLAVAAVRSSTIAASARVLQLQGSLAAIDEQGQRRALILGASVYPGDIVETASNASALLAFRDDSKISLGASTRLRVDDFAFDASQPGTSRYFMSLLMGSLRAITGVIGKTNRQNVRFTSSTATIGIRGTELFAECTGLCAGEAFAANGGTGLTVFTFDGIVVVNPNPPVSAGGSAPGAVPIELVAGRGVVISGRVDASGALRMEPLTAPPGQNLPASPAGVVIPPDLFSQVLMDETTEGLYVFVREGHVTVATQRQQLDLGRNEAAYSGPALEVLRLQNIPNHVARDPVPLPTASNINISGLRPLSNNDEVCR